MAELLTTNKLSELACLTLYLMYEKKNGRQSVWFEFIQVSPCSSWNPAVAPGRHQVQWHAAYLTLSHVMPLEVYAGPREAHYKVT